MSLLASIIPAAISGAVGLFSNVAQNQSLDKQIAHQEDAQRKQNEANMLLTQEYNKAQKELAQSQNEFNVEMWNRQNEYNSPEATMKRLVDAGINPRAYQQIGQFANAGSPQPAVTPEQKMQSYVEPKMASNAIRAQRLAIRNAFTEQQIKAVELSSDLLLAKDKLSEQKRHNTAIEEETNRHNTAVENADIVRLAQHEDAFKVALLKEGIQYNSADRTFKLPEWLKNKPKEEHIAYIQKAMAETAKIMVERQYLIDKGIIEVDKATWEREKREFNHWWSKIMDVGGLVANFLR